METPAEICTALTAYRDKAFAFANPAKNATPEQVITNAALGLCGEAAELRHFTSTHDDIVKELGDFLWYLNLMAIGFDIEYTELVDTEIGYRVYDSNTLLVISGEIAETVKKALFQEHGLTYARLIIHKLLRTLIHVITFLCRIYSVQFTDMLDANLAKLLKRYPTGAFSVEHSVNRTTES